VSYSVDVIKREGFMETVAVVGLDLAKQVFQVHGVNKNGKALFNQQLMREEVKPFFQKLRCCRVAMEASGGAHYWARELCAMGHSAMLIPGQYVKPFVKRGKSDALDARALAVAATQEGMQMVRIKSAEEQAVTTTMKARMLFVRERTNAINSLRSLLAEFGYVVPSSRTYLGRLSEILHAAEAQIPQAARLELLGILVHIRSLDEHIDELSNRLTNQINQDERTLCLTTIPGIGPMSAAMIKAFVPDPSQFRSGRHFASWIGLTPRSISSGGNHRLGHISKKGNKDLRSVLVIGAFSVVRNAKARGNQSPWLMSLTRRKPFKVAAVAVANKNARIAWAMMMKGGAYNPSISTECL
jgi:transposase